MSLQYRNNSPYRSNVLYRTGQVVVGYIIDIPQRLNTSMRSRAKALRNKAVTTAPKSRE